MRLPGPPSIRPSLFDVDANELPRSRALVAVDRLRRLQSRTLPQSFAPQHRRNGRQRHSQPLGDLGRRQPKPAQLADRRYPLGRRLVRNPTRHRPPVDKTLLTMASKARQPPIDRALAHARRLGRHRHRPPLNHHSIDYPPPPDRTERRVSVNLHLGLLELSWLGSCSASSEARMSTDKGP